MVKRGALLLLLAVAANQVDLYLSEAITGPTTVEFSSCNLRFFGKEFSKAEVSYPDGSVKLCFKNEDEAVSSDCLSMADGGGADTVNMETVKVVTDSEIQEKLSQFTTTSDCHILLTFSEGTDTSIFEWRIYNFGPQTALRINSYADDPAEFKIAAKVGESTVATWDLTNQQVKSTAYEDLSGCRANDAVIRPQTEIDHDSGTCTTTICDASAKVIDLQACSETEVCNGNDECVATHVVCTVTGSSVIDFFNSEHKIKNRCAFSLLKPSEGSDFELVAVFKERRRKDVAFLDHLILSHDGEKLYLEQGGRVRAGDETLTLGDTFETQHGVELRKDQSAVHLKIPSTKMELFFDGYTAHITAPDAEPVLGLCGNPAEPDQTTSPSDQKSSESAEDCEAEHTDDNEDPDCTSVTAHCELMKQAPFEYCHEKIDPLPYIDACKDILCHYPVLDGHKCQFFEAYAESCKLKHDITVDWSSVEGCSAGPRPCQDHYCSEDEFCGEKPGGTRCFCRALFAANYKDTFGEPTVCKQNSATLTLAQCLLEDEGVDYKVLHLLDKECGGEFNDETHMVTFHFDINKKSCGAKVKEEDGKLTFTNEIVSKDTSNDVIVRHDQVKIDFSCYYKKPEINDVTFNIADSSVIKTYVSDEWTYDLTMSTYTDAEHLNLISPDTKIQLNQRVWVVLTTEGLENSNIAVVTKSCWATSAESVDDEPRYDLIHERCGEDSTLKVEENGQGLSASFSFNMFQFNGKKGQIYLNCQVELCPTEDQDCVPDCDDVQNGRRRRSLRSKYADRHSALISMTWNK